MGFICIGRLLNGKCSKSNKKFIIKNSQPLNSKTIKTHKSYTRLELTFLVLLQCQSHLGSDIVIGKYGLK